mgnify:CR=1 FL=1
MSDTLAATNLGEDSGTTGPAADAFDGAPPAATSGNREARIDPAALAGLLAELADLADPPEARSILLHGVDGFTHELSLDAAMAPTTLVAPREIIRPISTDSPLNASVPAPGR